MSQITFEAIRQRLAARSPARPDRTGRIEASVALVLASVVNGLELLLIRRADLEGDPWSGQMGLPGGRREDRDEDLLATVRRETWEETGIALAAESLLGELDGLAPTTPVLPPVLVRPYVFSMESRPAIRTSAEVADILWVPLASLPDLERMTTVSVRGADRRVPAFVVGPQVVWGLTHRILKSFLDLAV